MSEAEERTAAVVAAAKAVLARAGVVAVAGPTGPIHFASVELEPGWEGGWIALRARPVGAPHNGDGDLIVVNCPVLVRDPAGDVEQGGERFRRDPLAAFGEVAVRVLGHTPGAEVPPWH